MLNIETELRIRCVCREGRKCLRCAAADEIVSLKARLAAAESQYGNAALREMLLEKTARLAEVERDAERYRWLRENDAVVIRVETERRGYRSTEPDAPWERWYEFVGWTVSTLPIDQSFPTMDAAIDAARADGAGEGK
jgi:hypothetical protein